MKIRSGYVSNSSSSSFIIFNVNKLSQETIDKIKNYDKSCYDYCKEKNIPMYVDTPFRGHSKDFVDGKVYYTHFDSEIYTFMNEMSRWSILEDKEKNIIRLCADMDNFDMEKWLSILGVDFQDSGMMPFWSDMKKEGWKTL